MYRFIGFWICINSFVCTASTFWEIFFLIVTKHTVLAYYGGSWEGYYWISFCLWYWPVTIIQIKLGFRWRYEDILISFKYGHFMFTMSTMHLCLLYLCWVKSKKFIGKWIRATKTFGQVVQVVRVYNAFAYYLFLYPWIHSEIVKERQVIIFISTSLFMC